VHKVPVKKSMIYKVKRPIRERDEIEDADEQKKITLDVEKMVSETCRRSLERLKKKDEEWEKIERPLLAYGSIRVGSSIRSNKSSI
jgi:hypothetical protein